MGILRRFRDALIRFMYGRNGLDQLNIALVWGGLIVTLVGSLLVRNHPAAGNTLSALSSLILLWMLFRTLSRNLGKRQMENQRWLSWSGGFRARRQQAKARRADKEHKYFTCGSCGTVCRVPAGKGKVEITCPKCGETIRGRT